MISWDESENSWWHLLFYPRKYAFLFYNLLLLHIFKHGRDDESMSLLSDKDGNHYFNFGEIVKKRKYTFRSTFFQHCSLRMLREILLNSRCPFCQRLRDVMTRLPSIFWPITRYGALMSFISSQMHCSPSFSHSTVFLRSRSVTPFSL